MSNNVTRVSLAVSSLDDEGWGVGADLYKKDENGIHVYHIFSLYLPRTKFTSIRRVVHHMIPTVLKAVREEDNLVRFYGRFSYFANNRHELATKAGIYAPGKGVSFHKVPATANGNALLLAQDAAVRKTDIEERLD
jgi:hypothetical protein